MIPTCLKAFVGPMTTEMPAAGLTFCITEVRAGEHSLDLLGLGLRGTTTINSRTKGQINLKRNSRHDLHVFLELPNSTRATPYESLMSGVFRLVITKEERVAGAVGRRKLAIVVHACLRIRLNSSATLM